MSLTIAAVVLGDERLDELLAVRLQPGERASLVALHEPAVADHVGRQDGGEPPLDPCCRHGRRLLGRVRFSSAPVPLSRLLVRLLPEASAWYPRRTFSMIASGSAVQTNGLRVPVVLGEDSG